MARHGQAGCRGCVSVYGVRKENHDHTSYVWCLRPPEPRVAERVKGLSRVHGSGPEELILGD